MKLKEFGPPGGGARPKFYYVDPPLLWDKCTGMNEIVAIADPVRARVARFCKIKKF